MASSFLRRLILGLFLVLGLAPWAARADGPKPRLVMFVGFDISGSFLKGQYYDDAIDFLGNYLWAHLNGTQGLETPAALFVGSLGGVRAHQAKTLYPIETFQYLSAPEIQAKLREIFPRGKVDPFTDFNAFFEQVASTVEERKLILKPVSVLLVSDGVLDMPAKYRNYKSIELKPLERLSRNITVRLIYTDAVTGKKWQDEIPRRRVKMFTQDAIVMKTWGSPQIFLPGMPLNAQTRFFDWVKNNVDFGVRAKRVD